jgi:hypothetical protein
MQDEALTVAARALDAANLVHNEMIDVLNMEVGVDCRLKDMDDTLNGIYSTVKEIQGHMRPFRDVLDSA